MDIQESIRERLERFLEQPSTEELISLTNILILYSYTMQGKALDEVLNESALEILKELET